jgi:hypothetical protein
MENWMDRGNARTINLPGVSLKFLPSAFFSDDEIAEFKRDLQDDIGLSSETTRRVTVETFCISDLMAETASTGIDNEHLLLGLCSRLHSRRQVSDKRTDAQHALSAIPVRSLEQLERAVRCDPVPGVRLQLADVLSYGLLGAKRDWERANMLYEEAARLDNDPEAMVN